MRLLLIGTARQPTLNVGSNGLGRHTYDFISKFKQKGVNVSVLVHKDSSFEWDDITKIDYTNETSELQFIRDIAFSNNFDVILDFSHYHLLSKEYASDNLPIINFIHDEECSYMPPNCMVANEWQKRKYTQARIFRTGIDVSKYPFYPYKKDYYSFCGKLEQRKGYDIAFNISKKANIKTIFAGPDVEGRGNELGTWIGEIRDHKIFCDFIGNSTALFYPSRSEAGGLGILEAMALGTPTITTNGTGTQCNVENGITGFVANDENDLMNAIQLVKQLNPEKIRKMCEEKHDFNKNFDAIFEQITRFTNRERW